MANLIEEVTFEKEDYSIESLERGDYELCTFINCNFANSDLSNIRFIDCEFHDCNLSAVKLGGTGLQDVRFNNCKMLGLHFDECSDFLFQVAFDNCMLNHSSFFKKKLVKTRFSQCKLQEVDFTDCNLSSADFDQSDIIGATFTNCTLAKADFRTALNLSIDPERNRMKGAQFSQQNVVGLLNKYQIKVG